MKVGDYVRDSEGEIAKIIKKHEIITEDNIYIDTTYSWKSLKNDCEGCFSGGMKNIKSSPNIIDLIEVGDVIKKTYKTGLIEKIPINKIEDIENIRIDIKNNFKITILTKEQFESMEYKIC